MNDKDLNQTNASDMGNSDNQGGCSCGGDCGCESNSNSHEGCTNCKDKEQKIADLENSWRRAVADYKNLERRVTEEKETLIKFSNSVLLERIIPVLDNLETLCDHMKDQGLQMITKQLRDVIKDEGVEEIDALGKDFEKRCQRTSARRTHQ
jgi:molecular chaperone GrpE